MADSEYIIAISSEFPSGQATVDQLDALNEKLGLGGRKSDTFRDAIAQLNTQLDAARAASAAANSALVAGNDQYASLEKTATSAARALERAQASGRFDPRAARAAADAQGALDGYTGSLRKLEGESAAAAAQQAKLENAFKNVNAAGAHQDVMLSREVKQYRALAGAARFLPGPLGRVVSEHFREEGAVLKLGSAFGVTNARMLVYAAAASAVIAITIAAAAATALGFAAFGVYATRAADAAREMQLQNVALASLDVAHRNAVQSFDATTDATGATHEQLVALTAQLVAAHVAAADMPKALKAAAMAETALGAGGAGEFVKRLEDGRLSVDRFAAEANSKFSGVVAERMRGLGMQTALLGRRFRGLFEDVHLDPVLNAFSTFVGMFDKANPLARALKDAVNLSFESIASRAESTAYAIEAFGLRFAIDVLKTYLFFKKYGEEIENVLLGVTIALGVAGVAWAIMNAAAVAEFGAVAIAATAAGVAAAAAWLVAAAPVLAVIAGVAALGYAIGELITHWDEVGEGIKLIWSDLTAWLGAQVDAFVEMGGNLIMGLVQGITGAVGHVVDAITGAVGSAVTAAKDVLGIHSPSTVFAEIGDNTAQGYTQGIEAGTPEAQGSVSRLVSPTDTDTGSAAASRAPAASAGGSRGGIDLREATFNFYGVKDAETARDRLAEMLTSLLEGDADSLSGAVPAPV